MEARLRIWKHGDTTHPVASDGPFPECFGQDWLHKQAISSDLKSAQPRFKDLPPPCRNRHPQPSAQAVPVRAT